MTYYPISEDINMMKLVNFPTKRVCKIQHTIQHAFHIHELHDSSNFRC